MKKRILAVALTLLLVISMAVPASAYYYSDSGTHDGCGYSFSANCDYLNYSALIEATHYTDPNASYQDYWLTVVVRPYVLKYGKVTAMSEKSASGYTIASVSDTPNWVMDRIVCTFTVNGDSVGQPTVYAPTV